MDELNRHEKETPEQRITRWRWVDEYLPSLRQVVEARGVPRDDAYDVAWGALLKGWDYLSRGETVRNEWSWLRSVARNEAMTYHRKRRSEKKQRKVRAESGQWPRDSESAVGEATRNEQTKRLWEALASLDPKYREAVEACVLRGQTVTGWAEQVGIHRKAAERLRDTGLRILREKRKDFGDDLDHLP